MSTPSATLTRNAHRTADHTHRLGEFASYRDAEQVVSRLSDVGFPVERVSIVGTELHSGKQAKRLTVGRAALIGAGLAGWLGLVAGLVVTVMLSGTAWLTLLLGGLLIGAASGAIVGIVAYWATDWRHASAGTTEGPARRYAVDVDRTHAVEAVLALDRS
jgi:hypothetical protein